MLLNLAEMINNRENGQGKTHGVKRFVANRSPGVPRKRRSGGGVKRPESGAEETAEMWKLKMVFPAIPDETVALALSHTPQAAPCPHPPPH